MMRYTFVLAAILALCGSLAQADNLLGIAPLRLILSDAKNNDLLTLTNRSEKPRTYKIVLKDQVMNDTGAVVPQDDFAYSAKRMLRFMPRQITLAPGQRQNIRVMAMMPEGLAAGDYHTHMVFEEQAPEANAGISPTEGLQVAMGSVYNVGIPVIVQRGKVDGALTLVSAKAVEDDGKPVMQVVVERKGNGEANAMVHVVDKATKTTLAGPRMLRLYREVNSLTIPIALKSTATTMVVRLTREGKLIGELDVTSVR